MADEVPGRGRVPDLHQRRWKDAMLTSESTRTDLNLISEEVAAAWLAQFADAISNAPPKLQRVFLQDAWWRDLLSFTWDLRTANGLDRIKSVFRDSHLAGPASFSITGTPNIVDGVLTAQFTFETNLARHRGVARLREDAGEWKAWTVLTAMSELKGFEENLGVRRPSGSNHGAHRGTTNWWDKRNQEQEFLDSDPQVVIVGGGQAGLSIAARLRMLGVSALIVERNPRIGDNWRNRYESLVLHDAVYVCHLPYLSFPDTWPRFTPKDKLAGWFEAYVESMELNAWTSASVEKATYDRQSRRWELEVKRGDGTVRTVSPEHVVLATGLSGHPNLPTFEGADRFQGTIVHSSRYEGAKAGGHAKALIVGASNSAQDIAQDLNDRGVRATILQRSSTYVMSVEHGIPALYGELYKEGAIPTEEADLLSTSTPIALALANDLPAVTAEIASKDAAMLASLRSAGFKTNDGGPNSAGLLEKYYRRGGGYFIDVGSSQVIGSGEVAVKHGVEIDHLTRNGVVFTDGTDMEADLIVLATGYSNMRDTASTIFGNEVASDLDEVWGLDSEGELRGVWRPSGHPGFWFMAGNLLQCRIFSKYLALQIKARLEGIL